MKKILFMIALILASATFVGCGGGDDPIPDPNPVNPGGGGTGGGGTGGGGNDNPGGGGSDNPGDDEKETKPVWAIDTTSKFEHTMSVWINISEGSKEDALAVFCGDECRGIGEMISDGGFSQLWCILVYGTGEETSKLTVKYWKNSASKTYSSNESFDFAADGQYGTADSPKSLTFK